MNRKHEILTTKKPIATGSKKTARKKAATQAVEPSASVAKKDQSNSVGYLLWSEREEQGYTLDQVAEYLKIRKAYLEAIEQDNFAQIPTGYAYVQGYLKNYARFLHIDVRDILQRYDHEQAANNRQPVYSRPRTMQHEFLPRNVIVYGSIVLVGVVLALWYGWYNRDAAVIEEALKTQEQAVEPVRAEDDAVAEMQGPVMPAIDAVDGAAAEAEAAGVDADMVVEDAPSASDAAAVMPARKKEQLENNGGDANETLPWLGGQ